MWMFGWVDGARASGWVASARKFVQAERARKLGWGSIDEVDERAKLLGRMIALIVHSLRTKSYEEFVASYSNPGQEPNALKRLSHKAHFQMRISPRCWYDATVSYAGEKSPSLRIVGGGDDFGVLITTGASDHSLMVDFDPADAKKPGRDAQVMVRALLQLPGYRTFASTEESLGVLPDHPW
jgi:hypothetical protein